MKHMFILNGFQNLLVQKYSKNTNSTRPIKTCLTFIVW